MYIKKCTQYTRDVGTGSKRGASDRSCLGCYIFRSASILKAFDYRKIRDKDHCFFFSMLIYGVLKFYLARSPNIIDPVLRVCWFIFKLTKTWLHVIGSQTYNIEYKFVIDLILLT